jgi:hypothetical protein
MRTSTFRPHGLAQCEQADSILTVHIHGDWNTEMRSQTAQKMLQFVPALNASGPWGIINHLHDTLVYSEEIYAHTRQDYAARPPESNLRAVAFVIGPDVEGAGLLKPKFKALLDGVIAAQVFADYESARDWMLGQLGLP